MPTTKTRINLTIPPELYDPLRKLAQRERVRVGTKALDLLTSAVEREEDLLWTELAESRLTKKTKWVSHKDILKKYA